LSPSMMSMFQYIRDNQIFRYYSFPIIHFLLIQALFTPTLNVQSHPRHFFKVPLPRPPPVPSHRWSNSLKPPADVASWSRDHCGIPSPHKGPCHTANLCSRGNEARRSDSWQTNSRAGECVKLHYQDFYGD